MTFGKRVLKTTPVVTSGADAVPLGVSCDGGRGGSTGTLRCWKTPDTPHRYYAARVVCLTGQSGSYERTGPFLPLYLFPGFPSASTARCNDGDEAVDLFPVLFA